MSVEFDEHHPDVIDSTLANLKAGKTLIYPTDTIYGIGCDALNPKAVQKVRDIKGREDDKPFLILARDVLTLNDAFDLSEIENALKVIWPGPTTVLLKPKHEALKSLEGPTGKIGVRVANDPFIQKLFTHWPAGLLISTSANPAGIEYQHDWNSLKSLFSNKVDLLIKRRPYPILPPSNILEWESGHWICHRGELPHPLLQQP